MIEDIFRELKKNPNKEYSLYNELAHVYDLYYEEIYDYNAQADFVSNNTDGSSVVDFACGTGSLTVKLNRYFERVYGIDINEDMINIASQKDRTTKFKVGDITEIGSLPFDSKSKDVITFLGTGSAHFKQDELKSIFRNCSKILNEDGYFIFDFFDIDKSTKSEPEERDSPEVEFKGINISRITKKNEIVNGKQNVKFKYIFNSDNQTVSTTVSENIQYHDSERLIDNLESFGFEIIEENFRPAKGLENTIVAIFRPNQKE